MTNKGIDDAIRTAFLTFAKDLLEAARARFATFVAERATITFADIVPGGAPGSSSTHPSTFFPQPWSPDLPQESAYKCSRLVYDAHLIPLSLKNNDNTTIDNPNFEQCRDYFVIYLTELTRKTAEKRRNLWFNRAYYSRHFDSALGRWRSSNTTELKLLGLVAFNSFAKVIGLPDTDLTITRDCTASKHYLSVVQKVPSRSMGMVHWVADTNYVISWKNTKLKNGNAIDGGDFVRRKVAECALTSLRLTKPGHVSTFGIVDFQEHNPFYLGGLTYLPDYLPSSSIGLKTYTLEKKDIQPFKKIFSILLKGNFKVMDEISLSLRRFNQTYTRDIDEDRIIDLAICLESCLFPSNQQEISFKIALRSALLAQNDRISLATFETVRTLYNVRSKIVHEGKTLSQLETKKPLSQLSGNYMDVFQETVRIVLRNVIYYLGEGITREALCRKLELCAASSREAISIE